jgi:hypothetical protein
MDGMKPTLYISSKDLPEIKDWKVGESYDLIVNVKMTGVHQMSNGSQTEGTFEVNNAMSADKDPMDLTEINDLNDNEAFMKAAGSYKQDLANK